MTLTLNLLRFTAGDEAKEFAQSDDIDIIHILLSWPTIRSRGLFAPTTPATTRENVAPTRTERDSFDIMALVVSGESDSWEANRSRSEVKTNYICC